MISEKSAIVRLGQGGEGTVTEIEEKLLSMILDLGVAETAAYTGEHDLRFKSIMNYLETAKEMVAHRDGGVEKTVSGLRVVWECGCQGPLSRHTRLLVAAGHQGQLWVLDRLEKNPGGAGPPWGLGAPADRDRLFALGFCILRLALRAKLGRARTFLRARWYPRGAVRPDCHPS